MLDFIEGVTALSVGVLIGFVVSTLLIKDDLENCESKYDTAKCSILYVPTKAKEPIQQYLEETNGGRLNNEQQ